MKDERKGKGVLKMFSDAEFCWALGGGRVISRSLVGICCWRGLCLLALPSSLVFWVSMQPHAGQPYLDGTTNQCPQKFLHLSIGRTIEACNDYRLPRMWRC